MAITRFVNAGADAGGDGTTNATSSGGGTHAYDSMSVAESSEQGDLSSIGAVTFECEGTTEDTSNLVIDGWTNPSAANFIKFRGNATGKHDGTPGSGFSVSHTSLHVIEIREDFVYIGNKEGDDGIEVIRRGTGNSDEGFRIDSAAAGVDLNDIYICGNIIRAATISTSQDGIYVNPNGQGANGCIVFAYNNVIFGFGRAGIHCQVAGGSSSGDEAIINAEHNFVHGCVQGFTADAPTSGRIATINAFNNICVDNTSDDYFIKAGAGTGSLTGSNNIALDATHNAGSMTGGADVTSVTTTTQSTGAHVVVVSLTGGSEDFKLLDEAAGNKPVAFGTNRLSTVGIDAFGELRDTAPDCGFFEFAAPPVGGNPWNYYAQM